MTAGAMPWEILDPHFYWEKQNLTVIADRHLPNGKRQHVVLEEGGPTEVGNADIFYGGLETLKKLWKQ